MTHPIPLTDDGKYIAVPVHADRANLYNISDEGDLLLYGDERVFYLPPGNWRILSAHDKMTEEQWAGIVEQKEIQSVAHSWGTKAAGYKHYGNDMMFWHTATESGLSLMQAKGAYVVNPYLHNGTEKPKGDVLVSYDNGLNFDDHTEWAEKRTCMMAGIAGGYGYFGEGWATSKNGNIDVGLICDSPDFWIYANDQDKYEQAQARTSSVWMILEKI